MTSLLTKLFRRNTANSKDSGLKDLYDQIHGALFGVLDGSGFVYNRDWARENLSRLVPEPSHLFQSRDRLTAPVADSSRRYFDRLIEHAIDMDDLESFKILYSRCGNPNYCLVNPYGLQARSFLYHALKGVHARVATFLLENPLTDIEYSGYHRQQDGTPGYYDAPMQVIDEVLFDRLDADNCKMFEVAALLSERLAQKHPAKSEEYLANAGKYRKAAQESQGLLQTMDSIRCDLS